MKDIPGYEGLYAVDTEGNIWSFNYRNSGKLGKLTPSIRKRDGYLEVNLTNAEKKSRTTTVHQIIMKTFVGETPEGMVICHNNGNPLDNRLENLRFATQQENLLDKKAHGTTGKKITRQDAQDIRWLKSLGVKACEIAIMFGISDVQVYNIIKGKVWT